MSDNVPSNTTFAFLRDFSFGAIASAIDKTATAPLERVKLLMQVQDVNPLIRSGQIPRYTGIGDCFVRVAKNEGIAAFWRGNGINVMRYIIPTQAINFAFKDSIKLLLPKYNSQNRLFKILHGADGFWCIGWCCMFVFGLPFGLRSYSYCF